MDRKQLIVAHIRERLSTLTELGKEYSEEKIESLASKLSSSDKTLTEILTLIDNKFSNQVRKINHNNYLASLKEYYLSSIDKLSKGNNCYLLSYNEGVKVIEQAFIKDIKDVNPNLKLVSINNSKKGYKKENSINNDYELIMSDIAYLLKIKYATTYRIFDSKMEPQGIVNVSFEGKNEKFLNMEEALHFVKEESSKFNLKNKLLDFHDKHVKYGVKETHDLDEIHNNIEYVIDLFKALPDITEDNVNKLKNDYLQMKIFELLSNSINNNLLNIGIIINKEKLKYTYELSPSYNKYTIELPSLKSNKTICNFVIVDKKSLLEVILKYYYKDTKEILSLIGDNNETLLPIINQIIKEHLTYDEYSKYYNLVSDNIRLIVDMLVEHKSKVLDSTRDKEIYEDNNILYNNRIAPFVTNYVADSYEEEKGSTILLAIVTVVLFITIGIILLAILAISKMDM